MQSFDIPADMHQAPDQLMPDDNRGNKLRVADRKRFEVRSADGAAQYFGDHVVVAFGRLRDRFDPDILFAVVNRSFHNASPY